MTRVRKVVRRESGERGRKDGKMEDGRYENREKEIGKRGRGG